MAIHIKPPRASNWVSGPPGVAVGTCTSGNQAVWQSVLAAVHVGPTEWLNTPIIEYYIHNKYKAEQLPTGAITIVTEVTGVIAEGGRSQLTNE